MVEVRGVCFSMLQPPAPQVPVHCVWMSDTGSGSRLRVWSSTAPPAQSFSVGAAVTCDSARWRHCTRHHGQGWIRRNAMTVVTHTDEATGQTGVGASQGFAQHCSKGASKRLVG